MQHNSQVRTANNNYSGLKADLHLSPGYHYETAHRDESDFRQPRIYTEEGHRGIGRKGHDNSFIDYHHLGHVEPRYANKSGHEGKQYNVFAEHKKSA